MRTTARRCRGSTCAAPGAHPGGGVTGAPGHNCAREVLRDFGKRVSALDWTVPQESSMSIYLQTKARPVKDLPMSEAERKARVELAAAYRIFDMLGWDQLIFNHITLRVPGPEHRFLINPFGLHYSEITASSLLLIDLEGNSLRETQMAGEPRRLRDPFRHPRVAA